MQAQSSLVVSNSKEDLVKEISFRINPNQMKSRRGNSSTLMSQRCQVKSTSRQENQVGISANRMNNNNQASNQNLAKLRHSNERKTTAMQNGTKR